MNDTDAGASIDGCRRSDAPKTWPASICIRSSRLRSVSDCAADTPRTPNRQTNASTAARAPLAKEKRLFIGSRHDEQPRADLKSRPLRRIEVDAEPQLAV